MIALYMNQKKDLMQLYYEIYRQKSNATFVNSVLFHLFRQYIDIAHL